GQQRPQGDGRGADGPRGEATYPGRQDPRHGGDDPDDRRVLLLRRVHGVHLRRHRRGRGGRRAVAPRRSGASAVASDEREPDDYDDRRPARRPRDDYDDGPDYSDTPHRGGLILSLGIASIVTSLFGCSPIALVLGGMAWVWGRRDLKAMDRGEMDPE